MPIRRVATPVIALAACVFLVFLVLRSSAQDANRTTLRAMTYNIEWFSEDANPVRVANLKAVLADVKPDIVGMEEIQSRKALEQVFDTKQWQLGLDDDPKEAQELAIAVRRPYVLIGTQMVFRGPALDRAYPNDRDALRAVVQTPSGGQIVVYVLHMKSRSGGRRTTDVQREMACSLLSAYIAHRPEEPNVLVMGDMNDAPNDRSVNMLETGDVLAPAGKTKARVLFNLTEGLAERDQVTFGLSELYEDGKPLSPVVKGAYAENERLRGQDYRYPQDVKVVQTFMDQILASPGMARAWNGNVKVYTGAAAMRGTGGRTQLSNGVANYTQKGDLASDHAPVYADFRAP
ncbi:MAG: endonuclease/exonuclease/phosphatase family protein [Fimbriimonadaceae bacterium]|nr:endonuclease/exonuclease/phosphatase family protein [Fimbriimonadaceae bacterium]